MHHFFCILMKRLYVFLGAILSVSGDILDVFVLFGVILAQFFTQECSSARTFEPKVVRHVHKQYAIFLHFDGEFICVS